MSIFKRFKKLFDPIDLTQGKILKTFVSFLIPIILSMIFQQVYSLTDSIIVGQNLGENEIAGVNDAIPLVNMVLNFTIGCTAGFSVIISNAVGAKDNSKTKQSIFISLVLSIVFALILTIIAYFLIDYLLAWINITPSETNTSMQEIYESARTYLVILVVAGLLSQMLYNLITSILRALGDSFTPFLFLVGATVLNIFLDLLFIVVFNWGVSGSAWATVLSQFLAALFSFIYAFTRYKEIRIHKEDTKVSMKFTFEHIKLGLPLGFQWSILYVGVVIMSASVIPFDMINEVEMVNGNPAQVGYGISNKVSGLLMVLLNAVGTGVLSFVAQNYGAKKYKRIRQGFTSATILGVILAIFSTILGFLLTINATYMKIFLSNDVITEQSIKYGNTYLYIALPFFAVLVFIYLGRNAMQALEKPLFPLLSGIVELLTRTLICTFLPEVVNQGPINCYASMNAYKMICFADPITWFLSALVVMVPSIYYIYKKFPKEDVISFND